MYGLAESMCTIEAHIGADVRGARRVRGGDYPLRDFPSGDFSPSQTNAEARIRFPASRSLASRAIQIVLPYVRILAGQRWQLQVSGRPRIRGQPNLAARIPAEVVRPR